MKQWINERGNIEVDLFDIQNQEDRDQFVYWYLGLKRNVKKKIENAFYSCYCKGLVIKEHPIVKHEEHGITYIEVHPDDILQNIDTIKLYIERESHETTE
jgi:hypothetical protein